MKRLAAIRNEPLSLDEVLTAVADPRAGAIASFSGVVRNHAEGRAVTLLEYEAYPSMAEREMARILDAIEAEIPEVRVAVVHRVGALHVGDLAVVCAASAPHREEAFAACHRCIDDIKATVPIWKREHGPNGPYWVGWQDARCAHGDHEQSSEHSHSRHEHTHGHHADSSEHSYGSHGQNHGPHAHSSEHSHGSHGQNHGLHSSEHSHDHEHGHHAHSSEHSHGSHGQNHGHHAHSSSHGSRAAVQGLRVGVLTVSDTRNPKTDESGKVAQELLVGAGAKVAATGIVRDEPQDIANWVQLQARELDAVIVTGGTGIAERDRTIEALEPLLARTLDGFGEAFRRASFEQIGPRAMLSRAKAGIVGKCVVFALPGSPKAVELAVTELVLPVLPHAVELMVGTSSHSQAERSHEG